MANLPGIDNCVEIRAFYDDPNRYKTIINTLVEHGHSFAVHGGYLYFSVSALDRLLYMKLLTS